MIIRKIFSFENAHIVRFCTSKRCKTSIHGHSYKVEILLQSKYLDNGGMVYDFGLLKQEIRQIIDSFDHSISLYKDDDKEYLKDMKKHSKRWVCLPLNASAENFCRIFFVLIDTLLNKTIMQNGEKGVKLYSVIVHETSTSYAQGFFDDAYSDVLPKVNLDEIEFSNEIKSEWSDENFFENLKGDYKFINKKEL